MVAEGRYAQVCTLPVPLMLPVAEQKGEKLKDEMDALVDEIDEVLEENAEEFVKNYVQRGGQ